jgi:hypothetical protein
MAPQPSTGVVTHATTTRMPTTSTMMFINNKSRDDTDSSGADLKRARKDRILAGNRVQGLVASIPGFVFTLVTTLQIMKQGPFGTAPAPMEAYAFVGKSCLNGLIRQQQLASRSSSLILRVAAQAQSRDEQHQYQSSPPSRQTTPSMMSFLANQTAEDLDLCWQQHEEAARLEEEILLRKQEADVTWQAYRKYEGNASLVQVKEAATAFEAAIQQKREAEEAHRLVDLQIRSSVEEFSRAAAEYDAFQKHQQQQQSLEENLIIQQQQHHQQQQQLEIESLLQEVESAMADQAGAGVTLTNGATDAAVVTQRIRRQNEAKRLHAARNLNTGNDLDQSIENARNLNTANDLDQEIENALRLAESAIAQLDETMMKDRPRQILLRP